MNDDELIEQLRDEISGWPIGSGYYATAVGTGEAAEIAAAVLPLVRAREQAAARTALIAFSRADIEAAPDEPVNASNEEDPLTYRGLAQARAWRALVWNDTHYPEESP